MTCIAAVLDRDEKKVWIGGDSLAVSGYRSTTKGDPKVFRIGEILCGSAGSIRIANLLRFQVTPPEHPKGMGVDRYMTTLFIEEVRRVIDRKGAMVRIHDQDFQGADLILGYRGRLYEVDSDFLVMTPANGYAAIGSGGSVANGSLYSSRGMPPKERIRLTLQAAEEHNAGVRRPFVIKST